MTAYARRRVGQLAGEDLSGYVLKKDSPSCGLERVKVYGAHGVPARSGRGLFAAALVDRHRFLPVEEEGRLSDPRIRDNFIERVFGYRRWRDLTAGGLTRGRLVAFHAAHKLLVLAHSPRHYAELGRLLAGAKRLSPKDLEACYGGLFMAALQVRATAKKHASVLHRILGYLAPHLDVRDRAEVQSLIADYARGLVPLVVPLTLLRHHLARHDVPYLQDQVYLNPHPKELMLRNHG